MSIHFASVTSPSLAPPLAWDGARAATLNRMAIVVGDMAALFGAATFVTATARASALGSVWALLALAILALRGLQRPRLNLAVSADLGGILLALFVPLVPLAALSPAPVASQLLRTGVLAVAALLAFRLLTYSVVRSLRARGRLQEAALIVGAGEVGQGLARIMSEHPEYGLTPIGFLDRFAVTDPLVPVLGDFDQLNRVVSEYDVRKIFIAYGGTREADLVPVLRACRHADVDVHVLPRFFDLQGAPAGRHRDELWGTPVEVLPRRVLDRYNCLAKRAFDVAVAASLVVLLLPLMAAIGVLVKVSSPGPLLFRQKRVGQHGRVIEVLKFRSMRVNDDSDVRWSVVDDDRVTPLGHILRKTTLDELPQLINVLRGDMSLVGPRPERVYFVEQFGQEIDGYEERHRVPVGMTGLAQVHGLRGDTSIAERTRFDNAYIEGWSLWSDIVILARTAREVVIGGERQSVPERVA